MQPNVTTKNKRKVTVAPVTTMEEVPVLTSAERAEFIDSLEISQAQINARDFLEYEAEAFKD